MKNEAFISENNQTAIENNGIDVVVVTCALLVVNFAIFTNGVIVICFIINRKKSWPSFCTEILSLCVCDILVGCSSLPLAVLPLIDVEISSRICLLMYFMLFATQCASLYHILGICIHRCIIIHNLTKLRRESSTSRAPLLMAGLAWVASIVASSLPTALFRSPGVNTSTCMIEDIFKNNERELGIFLFVVYLVPHVLTNILYVLACLLLKQNWKKMTPAPQNIAKSTALKASIKNQKKVLLSVGFIMMIFNVCTIPQVVMFQLQIKNMDVKRNVRFVASTMFILNSSLDPFVYSLNNEWLKSALKTMLNDFINQICP